METNYLIAKYVDDIGRNEPRNVGIIVADGEHAIARFDGEVGGEVDRRKIRFRIAGSRTYKAWVEYWRRGLAEPGVMDKKFRGAASGSPDVIEHVLGQGSPDFYLERGGTVMLDLDRRPLEQVANELYERLVREPEPPGSKSLRERSQDALKLAGVPTDDDASFKVDLPVELNVGGATVSDEISFAVKNGDWHALQEVGFSHDKKKVSRREAGHAAYVFEHGPWRPEQRVVLYDRSEIGHGQYALLEMLMRIATPVNVGDPEAAAAKLSERLHLG